MVLRTTYGKAAEPKETLWLHLYAEAEVTHFFLYIARRWHPLAELVRFWDVFCG